VLLDACYLVLRVLVLPSPPGGTLLQSVVAGLSTMPAIAAHYVRTLFFPWPLALDYVIPGALQIAVAAAIVGIWIFFRRVPGMLEAAALAALPLLLPVAATPAMYDLKIQDRYTYLATAGACLAVALLLRRLPGRGLLLACFLLVPLGALGTYLQIQFWQDNETLWTHTLEVTPSSRFGALDLGYAMYVEKRFGEAERVYRNALRYHPDDVELKRNLAIVEKEQRQGRAR
jgi:peptidoglycan/LPS O-acetylase OafA/YrhL